MKHISLKKVLKGYLKDSKEHLAWLKNDQKFYTDAARWAVEELRKNVLTDREQFFNERLNFAIQGGRSSKEQIKTELAHIASLQKKIATAA